MLINTPISLGELVDKISILIIKQKNINDESKLDHVKKELDFLRKTLMNYIKQEEINDYLENLININSKLWNIEDEIRVLEKMCIKVNNIPDTAYVNASSKLYPALMGYASVVTPSYHSAQKKPNIPDIGINIL